MLVEQQPLRGAYLHLHREEGCLGHVRAALEQPQVPVVEYAFARPRHVDHHDPGDHRREYVFPVDREHPAGGRGVVVEELAVVVAPVDERGVAGALAGAVSC